jgi:hypothetical protein
MSSSCFLLCSLRGTVRPQNAAHSQNLIIATAHSRQGTSIRTCLSPLYFFKNSLSPRLDHAGLTADGQKSCLLFSVVSDRITSTPQFDHKHRSTGIVSQARRQPTSKTRLSLSKLRSQSTKQSQRLSIHQASSALGRTSLPHPADEC